jgi:hypothetical protein
MVQITKDSRLSKKKVHITHITHFLNKRFIGFTIELLGCMNKSC